MVVTGGSFSHDLVTLYSQQVTSHIRPLVTIQTLVVTLVTTLHCRAGWRSCPASPRPGRTTRADTTLTRTTEWWGHGHTGLIPHNLPCTRSSW